MTIIRWAALALALMLCAPVAALAQAEGSSVQFPAGFAPSQSICTKQANGKCIPVSADNPLPVTGGGGGGGSGDASASNQLTQITAEQAIRDRIGAQSSPVAGSTNKLLTDILTAATDTAAVATAPKASATETRTNVAASTSSTLLLAANANRTGCAIVFDSGAIAYIGLSSGVSATSFSYTIDAKTTVGGSFECPYGWTGPVYAAWASATGTARVGERSQ